MTFILDGNQSFVESNSTNPLVESSVIFSAGDLADGDHQLFGNFILLALDGLVTLNYVECVVPLFHSAPRVLR